MADDPTQQTGNPTGQGTQDSAGAPPPAPPATEAKTVQADEHQRELDKYRNQIGQANRRAEELAAKLAQLEEAGKTEAERLAEKAAKADALEPEVTALRAALTAEVEEQRKALPAEMLELMPEGNPTEQLAWIRKARAAADKLKPGGTLPPAGGRNPAHGADQVNDKLILDKATAQYPALRGRRLLGA